MIKAILFDLDGVLIETEKETFKFYQKILGQDYGIFLKDEDFKYKAGRKSKDFWNDILTPEQQEKIDVKKLTQNKREAFNTDPDKYVKAMPGGKKLLELLKGQGFKLALASQNESRMIESMMRWLGIKEYFEVILSIDQITNLKPDPEIYLLAAQKLGVTPAECVVIEDSKDGVGSAKNAGMKCIGINHPYTPPGALNAADTTVDALSDINPAVIHTL
ncbi:MAG: HAD family phosphatase [Candidatus Buchananbacteria bacterium]|nr:HAD family phosphatase [Candidatus Buchananbacteria bacterium]